MSEISNLSEQNRQDYLKAMGIQPWFPRYDLPNALPPRGFDLPTEVNASQQPYAKEQLLQDLVHASPPPGSSEKMGSAQVLAMTTLAPEAAKAATETKPLPREEETVKAKPKEPISRFRLATLSPNEECLVITEMPHTGLSQFTRFHQRLLNDILLALELPTASSNEEDAISEFLWPLGNQGLMEHINQDDNAAADAVCAYLSNQFGLARRKVVLLLGRATARFVIDPNRSFTQLRGIQPGLHAQQRFAVSYSLHELMKVPALKAETWKDLSPLRDRT